MIATPRNRVGTSRETEIKLRIDDPESLLRLLNHLGARSGGRVFEQNTLYDTPDGRFRRAGCLLRVREESPAAGNRMAAGPRRTVLTWKAPVAGQSLRYKEKFEQEVVSRKRRDWAKTLKSLRLRPTFQYEKYRTSFHWCGLHFDFDETPVGDFLEIEGPPGAIDRGARRLGFTVNDYSRETYWDLYVAHCKSRGRVPRKMLFSRQNLVKRPVFA